MHIYRAESPIILYPPVPHTHEYWEVQGTLSPPITMVAPPMCTVAAKRVKTRSEKECNITDAITMSLQREAKLKWKDERSRLHYNRVTCQMSTSEWSNTKAIKLK